MKNELMDRPAFSVAEVAEALDIPAETLRSWIKRGDIYLVKDEPDERHPGTGRSRKFTLRRALHIGLMARLVGAGMAPRAASWAALQWTDNGDRKSYWEGESADEKRERATRERDPGGFYPIGDTLFVVWHGLGTEDQPNADTVQVTDKTSPQNLFVRSHKFAHTIIVVDLSNLDMRVRSRLRMPMRWQEERQPGNR